MIKHRINPSSPDIQYRMLSRVELKFLKLFSSSEEVRKINEILDKKERNT